MEKQIMKKQLRQRIPIYDRIMRKTIVGPDVKNDCWLWQGGKNQLGFGLIKGEDQEHMVTVHRAMAKHCGYDIVGVEVQHTCTNYNCVNPRHLKIGDNESRTKTIRQRYGHPLAHAHKHNPYRRCKHCGGVSYFTWFNRQHGECYTYIGKK